MVYNTKKRLTELIDCGMYEPNYTFGWGGLKWVNREEDGEWSFFAYDKGYLIDQICYTPIGGREKSARWIAQQIWEAYNTIYYA